MSQSIPSTPTPTIPSTPTITRSDDDDDIVATSDVKPRRPPPTPDITSRRPPLTPDSTPLRPPLTPDSTPRRPPLTPDITPRRPPLTPAVSNFSLQFPDLSSSEEEDEEEDEQQQEVDQDRSYTSNADDDGVASLLEGDISMSRLVLEGDDVDDVPESVVHLTNISSTELSNVLRRQRLRGEGRDEDDEDTLSDTVMSVIYAGGKLGAACYHLDTSELLVLADTAEAGPDFYVFRSLYRQIVPRCLLINGGQDDDFRKLADDLCGEEEVTRPLLSESSAPPPHNPQEPKAHTQLILLQSKLFSPEGCKNRLLAIKVPYEPKDSSDEEHNLFISSLLPLGNEKAVRAAGALLQYLDKRGRELFQIELVQGIVPVLSVSPCGMDDIVMVDDTAWKSLQIFSLDLHPSSVKQGMHIGAKEGLSIFSCLKQGCSTGMGARALRLMLLRPSRDVSLLRRRYDVIEYCNQLRNLEFTKAAKDCLKTMKNLPKLLYHLTLLHASVAEWKELYSTMFSCITLGEICAAQPSEVTAFAEIGNPAHLSILRTLTGEMMQIIDFEESIRVGRIVARAGIDDRIDTKKHQLSCLPDILALVAREELNSLPGYVSRCQVVYIPEVGYLLSIGLWRENLTEDDLQIDNFDFTFISGDSAYYKTPRTRELDVILGDCQVAILELETGIMIYLSERILSEATVILRIGRLAADLDCLISMSTLAKNSSYVRPSIITTPGRFEIIAGRHPLVDVIGGCVPNTTKFLEAERVVVLTGPNASGKSVYLKQVGVICIMALSGSFVPAKSVKIPTFDRICTRIHAPESISTGISSFMMDLNQMSLALRTSTDRSLLLIDEFGKGTAETDGLCLLVASVNDLLNRKNQCPVTFVSTHFNTMMNYLDDSNVLKLQRMKYLQQDAGATGGITYLYELTDGVSVSSFARQVAQEIGLPSNLIHRSAEMERIVRSRAPNQKLNPNTTQAAMERHQNLTQVGEWFLKLGISAHNATQIVDRVNTFLTQPAPSIPPSSTR